MPTKGGWARSTPNSTKTMCTNNSNSRMMVKNALTEYISGVDIHLPAPQKEIDHGNWEWFTREMDGGAMDELIKANDLFPSTNGGGYHCNGFVQFFHWSDWDSIMDPYCECYIGYLDVYVVNFGYTPKELEKEVNRFIKAYYAKFMVDPCPINDEEPKEDSSTTTSTIDALTIALVAEIRAMYVNFEYGTQMSIRNELQYEDNVWDAISNESMSIDDVLSNANLNLSQWARFKEECDYEQIRKPIGKVVNYDDGSQQVIQPIVVGDNLYTVCLVNFKDSQECQSYVGELFTNSAWGVEHISTKIIEQLSSKYNGFYLVVYWSGHNTLDDIKELNETIKRMDNIYGDFVIDGAIARNECANQTYFVGYEAINYGTTWNDVKDKVLELIDRYYTKG